MSETVVLEKGDKVYLVGPVAPFSPSEGDLEELAFADALRKQAPNENLLWMRGSYVEADNPNDNGAMWTSHELAIKSLTPVFMPVNVMHDPRSAVGLIADTRLLTREVAHVERSRIDNTLGIWKHRFPEVAEEAMENYSAGTLAQSMECTKAYYDCGTCGQRYPNWGGKERVNWCAHLRGENGQAVRTLGNVTFTGTGLIFGSRGARPAYTEADLDVLTEEVAEFHEKARERPKPQGAQPRMDPISVPKNEYDELVAKASRVDAAEQKVTAAETAAAKVPELETQITTLEGEKAAAETRATAAEQKVTTFEEASRTQDLAKTRIEALGGGFRAKLEQLPHTKSRVEEQAGTLKDEEWDGLLKQIEETAGVKRDAAADGETPPAPTGGETAATGETARTGFGAGPATGGNGGSASRESTKSVVGGLAAKLGPQTQKTPA